MEDTISLSATRTFLGGVAVLQALAALRAPAARDSTSNALGATVCFIAWQVYSQMTGASVRADTTLRYADWVVTTPLMLVEFFILFGVDVRSHWRSVAAAVALIVACILLGRRAVMYPTTPCYPLA